MGREGRHLKDVVTTRKLEVGGWSIGEEVQGTPDTTRANGVGREGRRGDINCTHKGAALVGDKQQAKTDVVTGRKEGSLKLVNG